jgi:malic enzyme-like protein
MYLLMSAFHSAPWLRLITNWRRGAYHALEGMDIQEARSRNALFAINGLLVASRKDLAEFQKPFAQDRASVSTFVDAAKALRPTGILGVSAVPKLFTREVIEAMAEINERPIIFPYSIPTSRSECSAEEAYRWSAGRAVFSSGSPFPLVATAMPIRTSLNRSEEYRRRWSATVTVTALAQQFHAQSEQAKLALRINRHNVGYLPFKGSTVRLRS